MKSLVRPSFWRAHAGLDDRARQAARRAYAQFARDPGHHFSGSRNWAATTTSGPCASTNNTGRSANEAVTPSSGSGLAPTTTSTNCSVDSALLKPRRIQIMGARPPSSRHSASAASSGPRWRWRCASWRRRPMSLKAWNHHTAGSMFSTVRSRVQVAGCPRSGPSGLWTQDRMRRDWSRRIRVKNESEL